MTSAWRWTWINVLLLGIAAACGGGQDRTEERSAAQAQAVAAPGSVGWVRLIGGLGEEIAVSAGSGADDSTSVLVAVGPPSPTLIWKFGAPSTPAALGLKHLDGQGVVRWTALREAHGAALSWASVAVSTLGNTFVAVHATCGTGCLDLGGGAVNGSVLVKYDPWGRFVWQRRLPGTLHGAVAVDQSGGTAVAVRDAAGNERLMRFTWDGAKVLDVPAPSARGPVGDFPTALGFDRALDLLVGRGLEFWKLDPAGKVLWSGSLAKSADASGFILDVGATAIGTVVVSAGFEGTVSWAGTDATVHMSTGLFMAVTEWYGAPRLGKSLPGGEGLIAAEVDPAGRLAVLARYGFCGDTVETWNLDGTLAWEHQVPSGCGTSFGATALALSPQTRHLRVAGWLTDTADLGLGPVTSKGRTDAFVVDLAP